jgi:hypothetical protein
MLASFCDFEGGTSREDCRGLAEHPRTNPLARPIMSLVCLASCLEPLWAVGFVAT